MPSDSEVEHGPWLTDTVQRVRELGMLLYQADMKRATDDGASPVISKMVFDLIPVTAAIRKGDRLAAADHVMVSLARFALLDPATAGDSGFLGSKSPWDTLVDSLLAAFTARAERKVFAHDVLDVINEKADSHNRPEAQEAFLKETGFPRPTSSRAT